MVKFLIFDPHWLKQSISMGFRFKSIQNLVTNKNNPISQNVK